MKNRRALEQQATQFLAANKRRRSRGAKGPSGAHNPPMVALPAWVPEGGVDPAEIQQFMSGKGGWTHAVLASWGVPLPPPTGWRKALETAWARANNVPRSSKLAPLRCAVCDAPCNEADDVVVTRGVNADGTLKSWWFCSQAHVDQWKADNPFPGWPPAPVPFPRREAPVVPLDAAPPAACCAVCGAPASYNRARDPDVKFCSLAHLAEHFEARGGTMPAIDVPF